MLVNPLSHLMTMDDEVVKRLINDLEALFAKVQAQREFSAIKQSEFRPNSEISFFGFLQSREQLATDASLLGGHIQMIREMVAKRQIVLDSNGHRIIEKIDTYLRQQFFR